MTMQSLTVYQRTQETLGNDDVDFHNDLELQRPGAEEVLDARYDLCVAIMRGDYDVPKGSVSTVEYVAFQAINEIWNTPGNVMLDNYNQERLTLDARARVWAITDCIEAQGEY